MSQPGRITVEHHRHVARVIIDQPAKRNALSRAMWADLARAFQALATADEVRVAVLSGAGDRAFCAGNDISEFAEHRSTPQQVDSYDRLTADAYAAIRDLEKPLIAAIRGVAVGGGFELAQLADLQIAAEDASFAMTPARLGLGYKLADVELLVGRIGVRAARELLFTGRRFDAAEALRMGLVTRTVPPAQLEQAVEQYAAEIAANAPLSVRALKVAIGEACKPPGDRDRARCAALAAECNASEDYREGQVAFSEHRPPRFKGR